MSSPFFAPFIQAYEFIATSYETLSSHLFGSTQKDQSSSEPAYLPDPSSDGNLPSFPTTRARAKTESQPEA